MPGLGLRQADLREPHHILILVDGGVAALPVRQRGDLPGTYAPDHDGMGVPLDDILDHAVDRRQCPDKQRRAGDTRDPLRAGKTLDVLQTALPGEPLGDFKLIGRENVTPKKPCRVSALAMTRFPD